MNILGWFLRKLSINELKYVFGVLNGNSAHSLSEPAESFDFTFIINELAVVHVCLTVASVSDGCGPSHPELFPSPQSTQ